MLSVVVAVLAASFSSVAVLAAGQRKTASPFRRSARARPAAPMSSVINPNPKLLDSIGCPFVWISSTAPRSTASCLSVDVCYAACL